jgi:anion-transporting  ArsA/GET3 family ATPase
MPASPGVTTIAELIADKRIIVCCGAGGVGKTTTSTGLALAAAREGRRVLALTVDPSKRLAETLGVARNLREPVSLPDERLKAAGIEAPGALETWMLDPQLVSDRLVRRLSTREEAERLTSNRIYKQLSRMVAGMQEYMAMEALHEFMEQGRYDLIVLDTPPSRNALDFLEGPSRLGSFLDGRIFQLFMPGERKGFIRRAASNLMTRVGSAVFGEESYRDLQDFFGSFGSILGVMNRNAAAMVKRLSNPDEVAFLMVASPAPESITDAFHFRQRAMELHLPLAIASGPMTACCPATPPPFSGAR